MVNSSVIKDKNLITISFGDETRVTVLDKLYQHDKGQILQFKDIPDGAQVEFSNSKMEKSIPEIVKDGAVPVPNSIVAENETVDVRVKYIDENSETTVKEVKLFVINGKEADYEIDPENEQTFREQIEGIVGEAKDLVEEATDKVEVNRKYLDEMEKKSTDTIENITTVGEAQINVINDTAVSQIKAINGTAQAQIESINDVAKNNINTETNSIVQAAQNQIVGINQVASGQIDAINQKAAVQINAIIGTANTHIDAINKTATSQINAINDTAQAQSKALQEQGDALKYDLAVKEKRTIMLSAGAYSDLIDVNEYDAIQVNSISCNGTDTISESLKLEVVKFKNGEQVGNEFLEKYNAIADLTDCDSIKLLVFYRGGISYVATVWYTLIVWDTKKEIERYVERVEDAVLIKPTASGTEMVLNDSSNMPIQELHLFGKNEQTATTGAQLFDVNDKLNWNSVFSVDSEGWISAVIPANTGTTDTYYAFNTKKNDLLKPSTTYLAVMELGTTLGSNINIVGVSPNSGSGNKSQFQGYVNFTKSSVAACRTLDSFENSNVMCKGYIQVKPGFAGGSVKFRFSLIEDTSMTIDKFKYEAYTGGKASPNPEYSQEINCIENPTVSVAGSNLLNIKELSGNSNGVSYSIENGVLKAKGTAKARTIIYFIKDYKLKKEGIYIFNPNPTKGIETMDCYLDFTNNTNWGFSIESTKINKPYTLYPKNIMYSFQLRLMITSGTTVDMEWKPQLLMSDKLLPYQPYKPIQLAQPICELNGIDDCKDELVVKADGTGQLIQRTKLYDCSQISRNLGVDPNNKYYYLASIDKNTTHASKVVSSHFTSKTFNEKWGNVFKVNGSFYFGKQEAPESIADENSMKQWLMDNKVRILFQLEEPVVTDLSSEEVQKVLALQTNKPNSTIWNDQNADIEVTYVADAKNYIDNKLAEIQALTLEGGN